MSSYTVAIEGGATHAQAIAAELLNLATILDGEATAEDQAEVRDRLVALADLVVAQAPGEWCILPLDDLLGDGVQRLEGDEARALLRRIAGDAP